MNLSRYLNVLSVSIALCYLLLSNQAFSLPQESVQARIAQGFNVPTLAIPSTPWMARLENVNGLDGLGFCGGVVIDELHVLTAAHCIAQFAPGGLRVVLEMGGRYGVRRAWIPHTYGWSDQKDDIAVLTLDSIIPNVQPLEIADESDLAQISAGLTLRVLGYGQSFTGGPPNQELFGGEVPYVPPSVCASRWEREFPTLANLIIESGVCAGGDGNLVDTCAGDSGGPLLVTRRALGSSSLGYKVLGLTSYGESQCGGALKPSVYTRVSHFAGEIEKAQAGEAYSTNWTQALVSDDLPEVRYVVITNSSDSPWVLNDFLDRQLPDIFFVAGSSCTGAVLQPGQSCNLVIEFRPTVGGFYTERLEIDRTDDDPLWIDLQGFAFETIDRSIFGGQPVTVFAGGEFGPSVVTQGVDVGNGYIVFEDFEPLETVEVFIGVDELREITTLFDVFPAGDESIPDIEVRLLSAFGEDLAFDLDLNPGWEELPITFGSEDFLYIRIQAKGRGFNGELRLDIADDGQENIDLPQNLTVVDIPSVATDVPDVALDTPSDVALETGGSLGVWLVFWGLGCLSVRRVARALRERKGARV